MPSQRRSRNLMGATIDAGELHRCVIAQSPSDTKVIKGATRGPGWFGPWQVAVLLYEALRQTGGQAD
jgi:hypothetical protein